VATLVGGAVYTVLYRHPGHSGKLIAGVAAVAILATFSHIGTDAVYWVFPFTLINYYIFPLRWALLINGLFLAGFFPIAYSHIPASQLYRVVASVAITNLIAVVFSHTVQRKQDELSRLATQDPLTGLGNRRSLDFALARAVDLHQRNGTPAVVAVLDLDHFKSVNDTLGHHRGDQVLVETAECLARRLRKTDGLYRFGGEEFVAVVSDARLDEGRQVAEELRRLIAGYAYPEGVRLTISVGLAELMADETPTTWLARADSALYAAKANGRDRVEVGSGEVAEPVPGERRWLAT
jgi:diguanylate cyclase (GGDEF)-like protein